MVGKHYLFKWEREIRNSASVIGPGIDVRGDGGYIVVSPSIHPNGHRYELDISPTEIQLATAPEWLYAAKVEKEDTGDILNLARNVTLTRLAGKLS